MVLAERNPDLVLARNGRRSRGPSPNGHSATSVGGGGGGATVVGTVGGGAVTPETSSDDDNSIKRHSKSKAKQSEYEEKIRVGRDYQAVCPSYVVEPDRRPEAMNDRALLVWSPTKEIPDIKLEEYISVAKEKYGYNGEQALGMLFWHKHDLERAVMDLANFTPFPDEWTIEDKVLFEQAFQFHGKSFHRIRQMLPDKSIASLVKYYYSWKKTRHRQSVMDRQEKTKALLKEGSENGSENGSNEESDSEDKVQLNKQKMSAIKRKIPDSLDDLRPDDNARIINSRWTNEELLMAVEGVRKFGKDFQSIADVLGTKTEGHVRTFYMNYRRRYNLDQVLKKYEAEKEAAVGNTAGVATAATTITTAAATTTTTTNTAANTAAGVALTTTTTAAATATANANETASSASANKKDEPKKKDTTAVVVAAATSTTNIAAVATANLDDDMTGTIRAAAAGGAAAAGAATAVSGVAVSAADIDEIDDDDEDDDNEEDNDDDDATTTAIIPTAVVADTKTDVVACTSTTPATVATTTTTASADAAVVVAIVGDESDNTTTSSEMTAPKFNNDEVKSSSSTNSSITQKDDIIMEIDLEAEQSSENDKILEPVHKKLALTVDNQDFPEASAI